MNKGFLIASIAAAFVFGMIVSASPVYGPHFRTWDGINFSSYLSTVENKLDSTNKFFAPPGQEPPENAGDAEITLKLIQLQINSLQTTYDQWAKWCDCTDSTPPKPGR